MAKRRTSTATPRAIVVRAPSKPQVIKVSAPRAVAAKPRHRRRASGASGGGGHSLTRLGAVAMGGAAYGFVEKMLPPTLTLPIIGRAGTIAIVTHYLGRGMPLVRDISLAAAVIAGYQLGSTGKIAGGDVEGAIVPQISGIASQV